MLFILKANGSAAHFAADLIPLTHGRCVVLQMNRGCVDVGLSVMNVFLTILPLTTMGG